MRYVIVHQEGARRDYFSDRSALEEELARLRHEDPELLAELLVTTYDDGNRVETERANLVLPPTQTRYVAIGPPPAVSTGTAAAPELQPV
jgi:hypothetical protein